MSKATPVIVFGLVVGTAAAASAQVMAGPEFRVNTYTTNNQIYPSSGRDARGNFVVTWDDRSDYIVKGQRYNRAGVPIGAEFTVNSAPYAYFPAVAVSPKGNFVVVWTHYPDGNVGGVKGQRFDASAAKVGAEFLVNTYTTGLQRFPNVAYDAQENFVVNWWSANQDGNGEGIFAQRFDAQGNRRGGEFRVNTYTTGNQFFGDISSDAAGNFVIAWTSSNDGSGLAINAQRYDASGAPVGANFLVNSYTTGNQASVGLAHAPDGSLVATFFSTQTDPGVDVIGKRYDASGNQIGAEFLVNSTTTNLQGYPDVAMDAEGNFVVSWWDFVNDGSDRSVWARRFRADGTPRGADFRVNTYTTGRQTPHRMASVVSSDPSGNFLITWWSPQDGSAEGTYAQRYGGLHPDALAVNTTGNNVLEPGETVDVRPSWFNANGASQTFAAALTNIGGPAGAIYTINDGAASYGTVANGTAGACTDCYTITISNPASRPAQHWDANALETITPDVQGQVKRWRLHVGASFTDVPTSSGFYRFVETLLHHAITAGCTSSAYCPASVTSRAAMTVFVLVAKEGQGYAPPACTVAPFADVPTSSPFCPWIAELARRGVVAGCGGGNFCPDGSVSREQMSVFVLLTLEPGISPPPCVPPNLFADVPETSPFCRYIEELANRGVVGGCGGGNYCPTDPVTREQMAVFISVTFGLALYGP